MKKKTIVVGLAGNPNSGKTSIFNALTGARQKVANWSGVTVEKREGRVNHKGYSIKVVDLPGTYSLSSYSIEEIVARDFILNENPDVIINVVDAGNLERNLYLTTQLIDIRARVVMALNMYDEAESKGLKINSEILGTLFGMEVIKTVAVRSEGIERLLDAVIDVSKKESSVLRHIHINYGNDIEAEIKKIQQAIRSDRLIAEKYSTRWLSIRLLEGDEDAEKKLKDFPEYDMILEETEKARIVIEKKYNDNIETIFTDMRYGFITGAIKEAIVRTAPKRRDFSEKIDKIVTNRILAFPILILFIWLLFELTFTVGQYPMNLIEKGVELITFFFNNILPDGQLKALIVNGIIGGIGGVIVFLPNILILFMGISFMEDTGYMARAAFIMDKIMHTLGLHGKSFISLVMGFGCNVPAIMATRSLENTRDRILTILINPFMSCSARLPVYILFAGTFFSRYAGIVITSLYIVGIVFAFLSAKLFQTIFFKGQSTPFVMELPPYRLPTVKTTLLHMWDRGSIYLKKVGGIILIFSIAIWVLSTYPKSGEIENNYSDKIGKTESYFAAERTKVIREYGRSSKEFGTLNSRYENELERLHIDKRSDEMRYTFIGRFGNAIYPVIKPLGFNWQMGISLTTGFVAKEIVVSTMSVLYHSSEEKGGQSLREVLSKKEYGITPLIAYTFLLFVLMYVPCLGTVSVIGREAGWKWAFFSIAYQMILAWLVSFIFYRAGILLGF
jgi:ferrous iron transport protein B